MDKKLINNRASTKLKLERVLHITISMTLFSSNIEYQKKNFVLK